MGGSVRTGRSTISFRDTRQALDGVTAIRPCGVRSHVRESLACQGERAAVRRGGPALSTWAIVSSTSPSGAARFQGVLSDHVDGVLELSHDDRPDAAESLMVNRPLAALRTALREVPASVERLAYLDDEVLDSLGVEPVLEMLSWLDDDHAAVVRAAPVTDALKRVHEGMIVEPVDRAGLYVPQPPVIVRRAALRDALGDERVAVGVDTARLLLTAGHRIRVCRSGDVGSMTSLAGGA